MELELGFPVVLPWVGLQGFREEKLQVGNTQGENPRFSDPRIDRELSFLSVPDKAWLYPRGSLCFLAHPDSKKIPIFPPCYPSWFVS